MHSKMFDEKIVESEFCFNKCKYHNHERGNWCNYYGCNVNEVNCTFVSYDYHTQTLLIGETNEITSQEENKIWEIIKQEQKDGKIGW